MNEGPKMYSSKGIRTWIFSHLHLYNGSWHNAGSYERTVCIVMYTQQCGCVAQTRTHITTVLYIYCSMRYIEEIQIKHWVEQGLLKEENILSIICYHYYLHFRRVARNVCLVQQFTLEIIVPWTNEHAPWFLEDSM